MSRLPWGVDASMVLAMAQAEESRKLKLNKELLERAISRLGYVINYQGRSPNITVSIHNAQDQELNAEEKVALTAMLKVVSDEHKQAVAKAQAELDARLEKARAEQQAKFKAENDELAREFREKRLSRNKAKLQNGQWQHRVVQAERAP